MGGHRLGVGETIAAACAILLFVFMFFDWFGVECVNQSNLLVYTQCTLPGRTAWEALHHIDSVLVITVFTALFTAGLHLAIAPRTLPLAVNATVAILGAVSALLILFRIVDPPNLVSAAYAGPVEATVQFPSFVSLGAAAGIAFGGFWAMWEGGLRQAADTPDRHGPSQGSSPAGPSQGSSPAGAD